MSIIHLVVFILTVYGTSWIITKAKISEPIRNWIEEMAWGEWLQDDEGTWEWHNYSLVEEISPPRPHWLTGLFRFVRALTSCIVCTGTWCGFFWSIMAWLGWFWCPVPVTTPLDIIAWGAFSAATCWLIGRAAGDAS
jgi:hypothetical protein